MDRHRALETQETGGVAAEATGAAAHGDDVGLVELVVGDERGDEFGDGVAGRFQHPTRNLGAVEAQHGSGGGERRLGGRSRATCVVVIGDDAQCVGGARVRQRHQVAVGEADREVVRRVVGFRGEPLGDRAHEAVGLDEAGVAQTGDVRAPWTDAVHLVPAHPEHRAAGHADDAHVDGPQCRGMAGDPDVGERRATRTDRGDIGGGTPHLDHDPLVDT